MYSRKEVLEIVDSCFHAYASYYRTDAAEYANELMNEYDNIESDNAIKKKDEVKR